MKKKIAALTDSMKGTGALDPSLPLNRPEYITKIN
jgi:hypothetical protein